MAGEMSNAGHRGAGGTASGSAPGSFRSPLSCAPSGRARGDEVGAPASASAGLEAERRLVQRVFAHWHEFIREACHFSSVPPEFLGALTAGESGGNAATVRFEPAVYAHLRALAAGQSAHYGGISGRLLCQELGKTLEPEGSRFEEGFLNSLFRAGETSELARRADEAVRRLASSWGLTQIMGLHLIGRQGSVPDLLEARFHYHLADQLLAEFAASYQLDLGREFAEMFRCWNTGTPVGLTADPAYVTDGLMRMEIYRSLMAPAEAQKNN